MKKVWLRRYDSEHECATQIQVTEKHTKQEPLTFKSGGPHEEGYSYTVDRYWMDEHGFVFSGSDTESSDCDGRLDQSWLGMWNGREWCALSSGQRDYNAEAARY